MRLEITFIMGRTESRSLWEIGVTQKTYFKLVSEDPKELTEFIDVVRKIEALLCFTINETVYLDSMLATSEGVLQDIGGGKTRPAPINIYDPSVFLPKDGPKIRADRMLFRFSDIQDGAEGMINKWIDSYKEYKNTFDLYFLAQLKPQLSWEANFLSLAQGLEVYHRRTSDEKEMDEVKFEDIVQDLIELCPEEYKDWLKDKLKYSNELIFLKRIKGLIDSFKESFGNSKERKKLAFKISVTRHYLTHYNPDLETAAAKGEDLYVLCQKMEMLFELHFLKLMGFSQDNIKTIAEKNSILQWKRSLPLSGVGTENSPSTESENSEEQED